MISFSSWNKRAFNGWEKRQCFGDGSLAEWGNGNEEYLAKVNSGVVADGGGKLVVTIIAILAGLFWVYSTDMTVGCTHILYYIQSSCHHRAAKRAGFYGQNCFHQVKICLFSAFLELKTISIIFFYFLKLEDKKNNGILCKSFKCRKNGR